MGSETGTVGRGSCAPPWPPCATGATWAPAPRSFRLGRRVLYRSDDLRAWVDAQHGQDRAGHS